MRWALTFALAARLWACTVVEGDRILGSHLAAELPAFASIGAAADLGPAPLAGARREIRGAELERLARKYGVELPAAAGACFERATQTLSEATLLPLLRTALGDAGASIEIVDFSRHPLPLGAPEFTRAGLTGSGLWRGRLVFGENRSTPVWARVRITDAAGQPVAVWNRSTHPEVAPGDTVRVEVRSGAVRLAFEATAESAGHVGEGVMVRNPVNGSRFRAIVESKGKVAVRK
jgi:hypothetical protein